MKGIKKFESWRAEEIAKVYLINSGLVSLLPNNTDKFDFLAISKQTPEKKIAIEVKATKYSKSELKRIFSKIRRRYSNFKMPVVLMYIDYDKENGFFEILKSDLDSNNLIQPLDTTTLKSELSALLE